MGNRFCLDKAHYLVLATMAMMLGAASAKTIAWYRFENQTSGATTQETRFLNEVAPEKYPAYPAVLAYTSNGKFATNTLAYTAAYMPIATNAFPSSIVLSDANDTQRLYANNGALALNMHTIDSNTNPSSVLLIDDHEDLHLQHGTIEFFARMPDTTGSYRSLFSHCGRKYMDAYTAFNLYGQLFSNGDMYLLLKVTSVDGEPVYNEAGEITNTVTVSKTYNIANFQLDNNRWRHIALVIDDVAKGIKLYVDHTYRGQLSYTGKLFYDVGYPFAFGAHPQCTYFNSAYSIDEVRFSDTILTPAQMLGYAAKPAVEVDENTLVYLPFEGATDSQALGADAMQEEITRTPFLANAALAGPVAGVDAAFYAKSDQPSPYNPQPDSSTTPADATRLGLCATSSVVNAQALNTCTNGTEGYLRSVVVPGMTANNLTNNSYTVEFFINVPTENYYSRAVGNAHVMCLVNGFQIKVSADPALWTIGRLQFVAGSVDLKDKDGKSAVTQINDGKWHHLALVYDKAANRAEAYVDYKLTAWAEGITFGAATYYANLMVGGSYWQDRYTCGVRFDDVRVSRCARRPYEFLTTRPVAPEGNVLARATFDTDVTLAPYADFFTAPKTVGSVTRATLVPARTIYEGASDVKLVTNNAKSLYLAGGTVIYPNAGLLAATDEQTVEFFLRAPSATAEADIARVNYGSSTNRADTATWALAFADAAGRLAVTVDTTTATGQRVVLGEETFADNVWHHVALTFAPAANGSTEVVLYRDGLECARETVAGRLLTNPRELNLMLGGASFTGWIDELRVTPSVLPTERFMTIHHRGAVLIFR